MQVDFDAMTFGVYQLGNNDMTGIPRMRFTTAEVTLDHVKRMFPLDLKQKFESVDRILVKSLIYLLKTCYMRADG